MIIAVPNRMKRDDLNVDYDYPDVESLFTRKETIVAKLKFYQQYRLIS